MGDEVNIDPEEAVEEDFAEMLEQSSVPQVYFEPGEQVDTKIVKITADWVFIETGAKSEGYLPVSEVQDENGELTVREGEDIRVYFLSSRNNERLFTTRIGGAASRNHLESAFNSGIPVEGFVEREIKGGYEVKIAGNVRSFCPFSLMGSADMDDEGVLERHLTFRIIEFDDRRRIVVSRKAILEEERVKEMEKMRSSVQEGMLVKGVVSSIRDFGAFLRVGPIEGIIPISEIGWARTEDINSVLKTGQEIEVVIKSLDWDKQRFSFSLKDATPDPWDNVSDRYPEGSVHKGTVSRLAKFGAFVSLEPGVDGLIHISKLSTGRRLNHPCEVIAEGQQIEVGINRIEPEARRISLTWNELELKSERAEQEEREGIRKYMGGSGKDSGGGFGTLGDLIKIKEDKRK